MPNPRPPEAGAQTPHEVLDVPTNMPTAPSVADDVVWQPERGGKLHAGSAAASVCALVRNERRAPSCC